MGFSDDKATLTQYRLVLGLDNGKRGDKGVELEDWLLRKVISIKKSPPK